MIDVVRYSRNSPISPIAGPLLIRRISSEVIQQARVATRAAAIVWSEVRSRRAIV
jgi:hypothetical protein